MFRTWLSAKKFYEAVFGVKLAKLPTPDLEMWAFPMEMERSGAAGALVHMIGFPSGGNSVLVYFSCTDCAVEAARVRQAGGRLEKEKTSIGEYRLHRARGRYRGQYDRTAFPPAAGQAHRVSALPSALVVDDVASVRRRNGRAGRTRSQTAAVK